VAFVKNSFFILTVIIMFLISQSDIAFANEAEFASSPNPVGSGARALGMGGAFIGVADDATAASWNPGGLFQVETPEISFVGDWFHRTEDNTFGGHPESNGPEVVSKEAVNYFSMTYPFRRFDRTMVVSLNYQRLYDFTRERNYHFTEKDKETGEVLLDEDIHYKQFGSLSAIGLAYSIQMNNFLSLGFTLNFWNDFLNNMWEKQYDFKGYEIAKTDSSTFIPFDIDESNTDRFSFNGFNANIGMMWRINRLNVGMVFKFPFTGSLNHEYWDDTMNEPEENNEELTIPGSYGIGLAYRFLDDDLTLAADIYRTEWQDFIRTEQGRDISPLTGLDANKANIKATTQIRLGLEYLFYKKHIPREEEWYVIPLRAGIFYDPAPARGGERDDYWGVSLGTGYGCKEIVLDLAYQYRNGQGVGASMFDRAIHFSQDLDEHKIYLSVIIRHFKGKRGRHQY